MLMERILSRGNLLAALKRVERNKGSHGVDGMPVQNLRRHIMDHWDFLKAELLGGTYERSRGLKSLLSRYETLRHPS